MVRISVDFNERTPDDGHVVLIVDGWKLVSKEDGVVRKYGLNDGMNVILESIEPDDDFEVEAILRYDEWMGRELWIATPDWSTRRKKP